MLVFVYVLILIIIVIITIMIMTIIIMSEEEETQLLWPLLAELSSELSSEWTNRTLMVPPVPTSNRFSLSIRFTSRAATFAGVASLPTRHDSTKRCTLCGGGSGSENGTWTILSRYSQPEMYAPRKTSPNDSSMDATTTRESIAANGRIWGSLDRARGAARE